MNLYEQLGVETMRWLDSLNRKKQLIAIHFEPKGARVVMAAGDTVLLEGLDKNATARLFMYLGFKGRGKNGFDTPAFASHVKIREQHD